MRGAIGGHPTLLHRLQQSGLRLGRGAVDFIRQQDLGENRTAVKVERAAVAIINRRAEDVRRQQVAGELHAPKAKPQGLGERLGQHRLADTGLILQQQMPASQQAGHCEADDVLLAKDDLRDAPDDRFDLPGRCFGGGCRQHGIGGGMGRA